VFADAAVLPPPLAVERLDWQQWDRVLRVNLTGAVSTLVASLRHLVDGGSLLVTRLAEALSIATGGSTVMRPPERSTPSAESGRPPCPETSSGNHDAPRPGIAG